MGNDLNGAVTCFVMSGSQVILGRIVFEKGKPRIIDPIIMHLQKNAVGQVYPGFLPLNQFGDFVPGERHRLPNPDLTVFKYQANTVLAAAYDEAVKQLACPPEESAAPNDVPEVIRPLDLPDEGLAPGEIGEGSEAESLGNPESAPELAEAAG